MSSGHANTFTGQVSINICFFRSCYLEPICQYLTCRSINPENAIELIDFPENEELTWKYDLIIEYLQIH